MKQELIRIFPLQRRKELESHNWKEERLEEIRVRIHQPVEFCYGGEGIFFGRPYTEAELDEMVTYISRYSIYAFEEELRQGFLTIKGGYRIGVAGAVLMEGSQIRRFTRIRYLNIRIARECMGCAAKLLPYLRRQESIRNTLIISMPGMGKTTYLRDCIYRLSEGDDAYAGLRVSIVDERSEIAGCCLGVPQNHVGRHTDVFDGCTKAEGILTAIRSMSPQVIAVDELGLEQDFQAVEQALTCGCRLIGTIHGSSVEDLLNKSFYARWLGKGYIERFVVIRRRADGQRRLEIYNERYEKYAEISG